MAFLNEDLKATPCRDCKTRLGYPHVLHTDEKRPLFLSHVWSENYCHWLFDSLSDLYYCEQAGIQVSEAAVFNDMRQQFIDETIAMFGIKRVDALRQCIHVKDWIVREYNVVINPMRHTGIDDHNMLRWFNSKRLHGISKAMDVLIIRRRSNDESEDNKTSRNIFNQAELIDSLHPMVVGTIEFERIPVVSQMAAIAASKCVIGVSGAGLANLVFADQGTRFIELQCNKQGADRFKGVAEAIGLVYKRFVYPKTEDNDDCYNWSITVDVNEIVDFVKTGTK